MDELVEAIIVGGGQAGLATSYRLTRRGIEHVVLKRAAQTGNAWHYDPWDFFTRNWSIIASIFAARDQ